MNLPTLDDVKIKGKRVIVRVDLDVPIKKTKVVDDTRLQAWYPTIKEIIKKDPKQVILIGHVGRPRKGEKISTKIFTSHIKVNFHKNALNQKGPLEQKEDKGKIHLLENLRFYGGEESNDHQFTKRLASFGDVYINDSFAASHREHASIVGLPKLLPHAAGLHLQEEVDTLTKILENPKNPLIFLVGGGKMDKALFIHKLLEHGDILLGGVLPQKIKSYCRGKDGRMCVAAAELVFGGKDISTGFARNFAAILLQAGTIVWDGPMGDVDNGFWESTKIVAEAVAESKAYKIVGGGDTIGALKKLKLLDKMDYVSTGGGAMLEFLAYGDLPGLRALRN